MAIVNADPIRTFNPIVLTITLENKDELQSLALLATNADSIANKLYAEVSNKSPHLFLSLSHPNQLTDTIASILGSIAYVLFPYTS